MICELVRNYCNCQLKSENDELACKYLILNEKHTLLRTD